MPPSASLCSRSPGAILTGLGAGEWSPLRSRPYAIVTNIEASSRGRRPPRAQAGRASLALRPHQDPLALATPGLADGQGFTRGVCAEPLH